MKTLVFKRIPLAAIALLLPAAAPGCASGTTHPMPIDALRPMHAGVALIAGDVEVRAPEQAGFASLGQGGGAPGHVAELRAPRGGSVVIGDRDDPQAKLWLRAGSSLTLAEDGRGRLVMSLTKGEARARAFDDRAKIAVGAGKDARDVPRDDVLVRTVDGTSSVVPTAEAPAAAGWTMDVESRTHAAPAGIGSLEARTAEDQTVHLALRSVRASAELAGDLAETRVEHLFHNDGAERLEGTFRFPLPEEASLVGLSMEIDGKMMDGELVEIDKARKTYETIVDEMRDPALLEWEHGTTFKLRVFPIEPHQDKRIVIRYVAPLRRELGRCAYVYPTATPDMNDVIPAFRLDVAGRAAVDAKGYHPTGEIAVPLADAQCPAAAFQERRPDGVYTAVRVKPSWPEIRAANAPVVEPSSRNVIIVCDTSRSTLESRPLARGALDAVVGELGPRDRFLLVAADVGQADHDKALVPATPDAQAAAKRFLDGIEPDGASDLGAALRHAGAIASAARAADPKAITQIVYVGDGKPTWGETDAAALRRIATESLGEVPLYAVLLGNDVGADLLAELTGLRGGFVAHPRSPAAAHRFALQLAHTRELAAISHVALDAGADHTLAPLPAATLVEGDDLVALVRTPAGVAPPTSIHLRGKVGERDVDVAVPVPPASAQKHVARRWAALTIGALEKQADKKDEIVKLSLDYQVMSKKTAFLVLESEEAYARYQIERKSKAKQQQADGKPQVSGGDLESLARGARLGMDRIQPGDPEIEIAAPADAQSVVVVFPFGETKIAAFDPDTRRWVVRFLIDAGTPDGVYEVTVRITHHDGRVELTTVPYVVDTLKPRVEVSLHRAPAGQIEIRAKQVLGDAEIASALSPAERRGTIAELFKKYPERIADARRVDVRLPDGTVLPLEMVRPGELRALWTPKDPIDGSVKLHVVAIDKALNQSALDVEVTPEGE